jgi:carbonic anhydrase
MKIRSGLRGSVGAAVVGMAVVFGPSLRADHPAGASSGASHTEVRKSSDQTLALIREASLALLKEGNSRFVSGKARHPNQDSDRRSLTVSDGQKPFATILACSDSRSPVELIFDRGVGELFVVRVAGNVADDTQLGSIEYGVAHLNTPLIVVLGHTGCGAVGAACNGKELPGHLPSLINRIQPAVAKARAAGTDPDRLLSAAVQANVWQQIEEIIHESSVVRAFLKEGSLQLVGGIYDLEKGSVNWLGSHPIQADQISKADADEKAAFLAKAVSKASEERENRPASNSQEQDAHPSAEAVSSNAHDSNHSAKPSFPAALLPTHEVKARNGTRKAPEPVGHGQDHH